MTSSSFKLFKSGYLYSVYFGTQLIFLTLYILLKNILPLVRLDIFKLSVKVLTY